MGTPVNPDLRTLSLREAMEATGLAERTLRHLVSTRRIPYIKVGRYLRFRPADLQTWLDENTRPVLASQVNR
ncbi:helix-turn-helix domain-containing protein [Microbacterium aerolatum]|uniref:Helix-turn-helix domain-containing protein n=1 Tax=Microbacterium aerolatum TaxID=153731 RepID=A0A511AFJ8_9MICO|nr:helix-turn-helix domain-containing protein [Microbacterium aerolatum]GEK86806.1 hypothetical protein MAE01_19820 [Microbacterium aerolatum]GGB24936.1 hypothetical protein GCM10007198_14130 [Microbacterium aerolatum]